MRKHLLLIFLITFFSANLFAQESTLFLKSGTITLSYDIEIDRSNNINYHFVCFSKIPSNKEKENIRDIGIDFLEYIPNRAYVVSIPKNINITTLSDFGILAISAIKPHYKIDPKLQNNNFPVWALDNNKLSVKVLLYKNADIFSVQESFKMSNYQIDAINSFSNSITLKIDPIELSALSTINEVWYIEPIDPPSEKENKTGRTLHRSNTINTEYTSGRHYNGEGINIMMQDDGIIGPHIDYQGRIDQSNCGGCSTSSGDDHGDHVAGTIMGSGNLDPIAAGMSDAAFLYVYSSNNNNYYDVPLLYQNNDVIITSKSYSNGCNAGYTSLAKDLDEQINLYPSLIHVFSAGNDGSSDCGYGAGSGWGNVTGGHKQGKNVIAVANLTSSGILASSSSRGPAADGRIKPDIGAKGSSVNSTIPDNDYGLKTGTSMSCPGIAGVMGQLYQAYKELNGGQNPNSSIMKNVLLNAADDIGNPGPDFQHGWGEVNVLRAVTMLENNQYLIDNISQGGTNTHSITIPSGTNQLKLMVYWHDKEASANASPALVNDLDIELFDDLGNSVELPWVLDTTANSAALNSNAIKGADHINNMEQITMDNPLPGNYTLMVSGNSIPFGPQEYSVSYVFLNDEITLTYPVGGEGWVASESEIIRWDAYGNSGNFTLEYTIDGGANWIGVNSSINGSNRQYTLVSVPNVVANNAKVRVSRNGFSDESDDFFSIINVPQNVVVDWICPDSVYVFWNAVSGATSYEVSMLGNMYMDSMTTTTTTNAFFLNPNPLVTDSWFSVCAKVNGKKGRRAIAVNAQPTYNGCTDVPIADFSVSSSLSCSGEISFSDLSQNQPNNWSWDFGDGNTSSLQDPVHNYQSSGSYSVQLIVSNNLGADTVFYQNLFSVNYTPAPITYNDTSFVNPSSFILSSSSNNVKWFSDTLGSAPLYSGANFTTPVLIQNTTYYARDFGGSSVFGGPLDNSIGGGGYYNNDRHLFIDCYTPSKLVSFDVYAGTSQAITFELRDNNSQVLEDTTITVQLGLNTLNVDFNVPVMNDLELGISSGSSDLYRNNSGASYPYQVGSLASITGHNSPFGDPEYHYFFYNLNMIENCKSEYADATAVFITSPVSIAENNQLINIFPNPTTSKCTITATNTIKQILVFDVSARLYMLQYPYSNATVLDMRELSKGMYTIKVITEKETFQRQIIIQ
ncbi:MAG: S8 family serine peptidase [Bacteroidetes bacterium]|nr:S8 family serine peptidase [Bacteroidota bacterium]